MRVENRELIERFKSEVIDYFKKYSRFQKVDHEIKERMENPYLIFYLMNPTERFFKILEDTCEVLSNDNVFRDRTTLIPRRKSVKDRMHLPEVQLLRTVLSESLTVTRHSFEDDFFSRYIPSVFDAEPDMEAHGNHIVYGRRGAGKSSLLLYCMHKLKKDHKPFAWVDMQTYNGRSDFRTVVDVLSEMIDQLSDYNDEFKEKEIIEHCFASLDNHNDDNLENRLNRNIPKIKKFFSSISKNYGSLFLFLDDIHVVHSDLQPKLLSILYSLSHGNRTFMKISGIEQFTKTWNPSTRVGLETPHDARIIKLDYNLTMLDKAKKHIHDILDAHAIYCGLPDINYLCGKGVLDRIVWVAAGVPRDAINIFTQSMSRASVKNQKLVSMTSVNTSASEMADEKLKDIQKDASGECEGVRRILDRIRDFCIKEKRKNAFLVEIQNENPDFQQIGKLIALRLLHVLSEGITPGEAGRRHLALMLDYGFYVGIRAARSVDLFHKEPTEPIRSKELRKLPIFRLVDANPEK
jgi:Cdc6-like AAA superfamily ATPase